MTVATLAADLLSHLTTLKSSDSTIADQSTHAYIAGAMQGATTLKNLDWWAALTTCMDPLKSALWLPYAWIDDNDDDERMYFNVA